VKTLEPAAVEGAVRDAEPFSAALDEDGPFPRCGAWALTSGVMGATRAAGASTFGVGAAEEVGSTRATDAFGDGGVFDPADGGVVAASAGGVVVDNDVTGGAGCGDAARGKGALSADGLPVVTRGAATTSGCAWDKYACVSQTTAAQTATAITAPTASKTRSRLSRFSGAVEFERPYPSVCRTASVCAVL